MLGNATRAGHNNNVDATHNRHQGVPYVTVNNINCRDFTHTVTIGGTAVARKGTACREIGGTWSVAG